MRLKSAFEIIILLLLIFLFPLLQSNATVVKKLTEDEMTLQAERIVIGKCSSVRSEWNVDKTRIFTYVTIIPQSSLKGDNTSTPIVIKQPGGEVDGIGMHVEGASVFEEGEDVFLFLQKGRNGFHTVLGLSQGKFSIKTDPLTKRKMLFRKIIQITKTKNGKIIRRIVKVKSTDEMFLDDFINRTRNILR